MSELSNFFRIIQFCPFFSQSCPNCPILSELSNFVWIDQLCSNCPILFELSNFVLIVQLVQIVQIVHIVKIVQFCPNCPIMSKFNFVQLCPTCPTLISNYIYIAPYRLKISILFFYLIHYIEIWLQTIAERSSEKRLSKESAAHYPFLR